MNTSPLNSTAVNAGSGGGGTPAPQRYDDTATDTMLLPEHLAQQYVDQTGDTLVGRIMASVGGRFNDLVADTLKLSGVVYLSIIQDLIEQIALGDSASAMRKVLGNAVERLLLADRESTLLKAIGNVSDSLVLAALATGLKSADGRDAITLSGLPTTRLAALQQVTEAVRFNETLSSRRVAYVMAFDGITATDTASSMAKLFETLVDAIALGVVIEIDGEPYQVWLVNARTGAATRYTDYDYNSFARLKTLDIGATAAGLFVLDGEDDAGQPINASLRTGRSDFDISEFKRGGNGYLGLTSDGELLLRVTATDSTRRYATYTYKINTRKSTESGARFVVGKGFASRYWQFELANVNGANFELDGIEIDFQPMSRRV